MKHFTIIVFILLLCWHPRMLAQSDIPYDKFIPQSSNYFVDSTKQWNTLTVGFGPGMVALCGTRVNKFGGEIFLDSNSYMYLFESRDSLQNQWDICGFIREDTINSLVYFDFNDGLEEEGLIYDFNLEVGDSIYIDNYYLFFVDALLICDSIDTVLINGVEKRRYFFLDNGLGTSYSDIWIEDIGSIYGLLFVGCYSAGWAGGENFVLCYSENDTVMYMDSVFNTCYIDEFHPKIITEYFDTAYLNIPYEFQVQLSDTTGIDSINWYGGGFPPNLSFNQATGMVSGVPQNVGVYYCGVSVQNGDIGYITDNLNSDLVVVLPIGIEDSQRNHKFNVYPNPFTTSTTIEYELTEISNIQFAIYNVIGEVVYMGEDRMMPQGKHSFTWTAERLPEGMYYAVLRSEEGVSVVKMVKQ